MLNKPKLENDFTSQDKKVVINAIMEMVFNADKTEVFWIIQKLINLTKYPDEDIRGLAVTSFGHVARLYNNLGNYERVIKLLNQLKEDSDIGGRAEDALEDIKIYLDLGFNSEEQQL